MKEYSFSNRAIHRELSFILAVLAAGAYISLYSNPLFCENMEIAPPASTVNAAALEETSSQEVRSVIKSRYFLIYCDESVDMGSVSRKLNKRGLLASGTYGSDPGSGPSAELAYMLDGLLRRTKEVLGMFSKIPDLSVKIFKDREELDGEYFRIFGTREGYKSFYVHAYRTIYTSEESVSDSVIVHEMAHAVIDNYFSVVPPSKVAEVLASYVDLHLEE